MGKRLDLHDIFKQVAPNVYFSPPENVKLKYPCIVYKRDQGDTKFANNVPYSHHIRYQVTVIDHDPDSLIPGKVALLPTCRFVRNYTSDNLNHDVYNLYY